MSSLAGLIGGLIGAAITQTSAGFGIGCVVGKTIDENSENIKYAYEEMGKHEAEDLKMHLGKEVEQASRRDLWDACMARSMCD
jgi:hypothetical protein